ncbi:MAG: transposase [Candidatus Hydrogenedentes bacterium]|nr:transposase [Candidatus Hydrogenedentota bacterium]
MSLWTQWWGWCEPLRGACARQRTFLWMCVALAGFCVRGDLWGVTSTVRALGLKGMYYDRLLDFFHSPSLRVEKLTRLWAALVVERHPGLTRVNGRLVLLGDGIKVPKAGKKMPGVKRLHQGGESNTKPAYILGHSCQAVAILAGGLMSFVAIPLAARIHEGLVFSNRDQRTLLDKMMLLLGALGLDAPYYFVADAYYASRKIALPLLGRGQHLVTRVRNNAVAYRPAPAPEKRRRGRPRTYGEKVALRSLFEEPGEAGELQSPVYGESGVILRVWTQDLLWRPLGVPVRFVAVEHPTRGRLILMTTDLSLEPLDVIRLYGYRFKIEVSFKAALRTVGAYLYHFWMAQMDPIKKKAKDQHLHRKPEKYRDAVRRKMDAYHRHIQLGLIAQGIMAAIATTEPKLVWRSFGSWLRTIRPGIAPSEAVVAAALKNTLPHFLADSSPAPILAKFIQERMDIDRAKATQQPAA